MPTLTTLGVNLNSISAGLRAAERKLAGQGAFGGGYADELRATVARLRTDRDAAQAAYLAAFRA